jgi:hypothetical protein
MDFWEHNKYRPSRKIQLGRYKGVARTYISFYHWTFLVRKTYILLASQLACFLNLQDFGFCGVLGHTAWICQVGKLKRGLGIKILSLLGLGYMGKTFRKES